MEIDNSIRDNLQIIIKVGTCYCCTVCRKKAQKTWNPFTCLFVGCFYDDCRRLLVVSVALTYSHIFGGIFVTWE